MQRKKIQNRICTSRMFLPVSVIVVLAFWWLPARKYDVSHAGSLALYLFTAYILRETNNINSLIRVRARSVSAIWFFTVACMGFLHPSHHLATATACLAASHLFLFRSYQEHQPVVDVFHSLVLLGTGSLFLPQLSWLMPFYFWYLIVFLRAFSFRVFCAGIIGFLLPAWLAMNICFLTGNITTISEWWLKLTALQPISLDNYLHFSTDALCSGWFFSWLLMGALTLWCGTQYLANSYNDKIRTRMLLYILVMQSTVIMVLTLLQPQYAKSMLTVLMVSSIPLIAHYFTLTTTWFASLVFGLSALGLTFIGVSTLSCNPIVTTFLQHIITKLTL